jgi:alpha-L-fucosidase 2
MVFGGVERERLQFNEDSLWTGDENPSGKYETMGAFQNFGDLFIELAGPTNAPSGNYRRELDLATAIARTTFTREGVTHTREAFASRPDEVIVVRWTASKRGAISGTIRLQGAHNETTEAITDGLQFSGKLPNGLEYSAIAAVDAKGGRAQPKDGAYVLEGCNEVVIFLVARTSYVMDHARGWRGPHPDAKLKAELAAASKPSWSKLLARHTADFQSLFDRVAVDWGRTAPDITALPTDQRLAAYRKGGKDPELEQTLFQLGRYLLISCSRRPGLPANLQGLWNDSNKPPWSSDYHSNINLQMNYWLADPANLSECALPFFDLVVAMLEPSRAATRAAFGPGRGWTARTSHNIFGGHGWEWNIPASAWYAQHFWEHFAFTRDTNYLRTVAYPVMKEICNYWEDHLKELPDGTLVVPKGWSPEHGPREDGVAHDQQIVWDLFTNTLEASEALGLDADDRAQLVKLRDRLVGPKIGKWGQLQEWMSDRDDPKDQHRHTSHLFAVYPGRQISNTKTPEFAKAAAISLEARGSSGDSRRSWTWPWRCAMWARFGNGEKAYAMIRGLLEHNVPAQPLRRSSADADGRQLRHHRRHLRNAAPEPRRRNRVAARFAEGMAGRLLPRTPRPWGLHRGRRVEAWPAHPGDHQGRCHRPVEGPLRRPHRHIHRQSQQGASSGRHIEAEVTGPAD